MDIGVPLRELGEFDIEPLKQAILGLDEGVWHGNEYRQET